MILMLRSICSRPPHASGIVIYWVGVFGFAFFLSRFMEILRLIFGGATEVLGHLFSLVVLLRSIT
jgi:hypothetical protein